MSTLTWLLPGIAGESVGSIRDAMIAVVEDIVPSTLSSDRFRPHREHGDFRDWAIAHPNGCLRRFSIRASGDVSPPLVTNTDVEWVETGFECVVAYAAGGRHGEKFLTAIDDVMESDLRLIEHRIGTNGYAHYGQNIARASVTTVGTLREQGLVAFGVLTLNAGFYRSMP